MDKMAAVAVAYKDFAYAVLSYCKAKVGTCPKSLAIIFDSYNSTSITQSTQIKRGQPGRRVYITVMMQKILTSNNLDNFLNNGENKSELVKAITDYYKSKSIREKLKYPLVVTHEEKTWIITTNQVNEDLSCNHIEADTRLILEASKSKHPVVIRASDTNLLARMCYADQQLSSENDWLMKIDSERYVNVTSIKLCFREIMCSVLPVYHCITGCDTTSYPANICKVSPFQKLIGKQAFHLLENPRNHMNSYKDKEHPKKFYHTIMYSGLPGESITKTRVRMYQKQRIKTSSTLISDEEKTVQHSNRSDSQCFTWKQCMN